MIMRKKIMLLLAVLSMTVCGFVACDNDDDDFQGRERNYTLADLKGVWQVYTINEERVSPIDSSAFIEYTDEFGNGTVSLLSKEGKWSKLYMSNTITDGYKQTQTIKGFDTPINVEIVHLDAFSYVFKKGDVIFHAKKIVDKDKYKEMLLGAWYNEGVTSNLIDEPVKDVRLRFSDSISIFDCEKESGERVRREAKYELYDDIVISYTADNVYSMSIKFGFDAVKGLPCLDQTAYRDGKSYVARFYKRNIGKELNGRWLSFMKNSEYIPMNQLSVMEFDYLSGKGLLRTFNGDAKVTPFDFYTEKRTITCSFDDKDISIQHISADSVFWKSISANGTDTITSIRVRGGDFSHLLGDWAIESIDVMGEAFKDVTMTIYQNKSTHLSSADGSLNKYYTFMYYPPLIVMESKDGNCIPFIIMKESTENTMLWLSFDEDGKEDIRTYQRISYHE